MSDSTYTIGSTGIVKKLVDLVKDILQRYTKKDVVV